MRVLATGGGTGGHVYPALVVIEELLSEARYQTRREQIAWVGSADSLEERILAREGLPFYTVATGALRGMGPLASVRSVFNLARGFWQARALIKRLRPEVVLATGGYVSVPLVLAARSLGCPSLVYLPDMEPGLAVRLLARVTERVAVSFAGVVAHLPAGKAFVSGYPVRRALYHTSKAAARAALSLDLERPVLLVLGGSRGARAFNEAVRASLAPLLELTQLIHICGPADYEALAALAKGLPAPLQPAYRLYPYLYEQMTDALAAADVVVSRGGASILGEFPAVGLPAVVVPYPYSGQHQKPNADYLEQRGAGVTLDNAALGERFFPVVSALLRDPARLQTMSAAARALAMPEAAPCIAKELFALARRPRK